MGGVPWRRGHPALNKATGYRDVPAADASTDLTVTENSYETHQSRRIPTATPRQGIINIHLERNGLVVGMLTVDDDDEIVLVSNRRDRDAPKSKASTISGKRKSVTVMKPNAGAVSAVASRRRHQGRTHHRCAADEKARTTASRRPQRRLQVSARKRDKRFPGKGAAEFEAKTVGVPDVRAREDGHFVQRLSDNISPGLVPGEGAAQGAPFTQALPARCSHAAALR